MSIKFGAQANDTTMQQQTCVQSTFPTQRDTFEL